MRRWFRREPATLLERWEAALAADDQELADAIWLERFPDDGVAIGALPKPTRRERRQVRRARRRAHKLGPMQRADRQVEQARMAERRAELSCMTVEQLHEQLELLDATLVSIGNPRDALVGDLAQRRELISDECTIVDLIREHESRTDSVG